MFLSEQQPKITLLPKPGFVIKTKILESKNISQVSTKVFINVCHAPEVPKPSVDFEPEVVFPLIIENQWEIPIIVSNEKETKDKKGFPSLVYDCCINSQCFQWCQISKDLKSILIEWCIESVELLYSLTLEREYSIPKMLSKGELSQTVVTTDQLNNSGLKQKLQELQKNETLGLIEEMNIDNDEEMDDEKLPDLMNITKRSSNGLIEEVGTPRKVLKKHTSNKSTKIEKEIQYSVQFQKIFDTEFHLMVKFDTNTTDMDFDVMYSSLNSALTITSLVDNYKFSGGKSLDIPIPRDIHVTKPRCFSHQKCLYIFV
ncbi:PIH1 Protein interacting with Hsp90 1 [Candida maltosa Xu316]